MLMIPHSGAMIFLEYAFLTCSKVLGWGLRSHRYETTLISNSLSGGPMNQLMSESLVLQGPSHRGWFCQAEVL